SSLLEQLRMRREGQMGFEAPIFLLLIPLLLLFFRQWVARNTPASILFPIPIEKVGASKSPLPFSVLLKLSGITLLIIALARPQATMSSSKRSTGGIDIMMVMDVSASMNIEDLADRSRFEVAKDTMESFIKGRENDRIGFIIFSGEPLTLAPPTLDYGLVLRSLRDAKIGVLKDGTGIGDGLSLAVNRLRSSKAKSRVIILLTDGDNNVGQVDPGTAGELAAGYGIRVYTIAIGREGRVKLPIRSQGVFGNTVTTYQYFDNALNPELLKKIAEITKGKFYRVTDESALNSVFREIDGMEKTVIQTRDDVRHEERFKAPLVIGLLLLLIELLLSRTFWRFAI
ncbi:MAG: VWA domain-containing protein, partial [Bdellovibrionales bacterium]|nr:VWA domain-containing protein [Bdellovibrionales bacterium]